MLFGNRWVTNYEAHFHGLNLPETLTSTGPVVIVFMCNIIDRYKTDVTVILTVFMLPTAMCEETCLCLCVFKTLE